MTPEVVLSLRCGGSLGAVRETVESALAQKGVQLELLAVDDGSLGRAPEVLGALGDARLRTLAHPTRLRPGSCCNLAVRESDAPFLVFLRAGEVLLPGALRRVVHALRCDADVGQTVGFHYVSESGRAPSQAELSRVRRSLQGRFDSRADYSTELLPNEPVLHGVRGYRREVFETLGAFSEDPGVDTNYDLALRLLGNFRIRLLQEYLYFVRPGRGLWRSGKRYVEKVRRCRASRRTFQGLLERGTLAYLGSGVDEAQRRLSRDVIQSLKPRSLTVAVGAVRQAARRRIVEPLQSGAYEMFTRVLRRWPLPSVRVRKRRPREGPLRVLYHTWQFPVLSQTFVQREVAALVDAGVDVHVLSDEGTPDHFLPGYEARLRDRVQRFPRRISSACASSRRYFRRHHPFRYLSVYLYTRGHRGLPQKSLDGDQQMFDRALVLAGVARELEVDHLHSPWAESAAYISLLASRLLGISNSVQARAYDIHRNNVRAGLEEKFRNARFVITNTRYNVEYIRALLNRAEDVDLHLIYNGIDLRCFPDVAEKPSLGKPVKLLCVARLVEQKGLLDLLEACKRLRERGPAIECEIIGAPLDSYKHHHVELQRLHRRYGLEDTVRFRGPQTFDRVLEACEAADICVLPCVIAEDGSRDITPNCLIEAMAMKRPVVSTTVTGVPEIVEDRVSGLLVPPGDVDALTGAIVELIEDDTLRQELARNARRKIERQFQSQVNIQEYVRLFRSLDSKG